jgi:sensor histidine kinase YesM
MLSKSIVLPTNGDAVAIGWPARILGAAGFWLLAIGSATAYRMSETDFVYRASYLAKDAILSLVGITFFLLLQAGMLRAARYRFPRQAAIATTLAVIGVLPFGILLIVLSNLINSAPIWEGFAVRRVIASSFFWLAPSSVWIAMNLALINAQIANQRERRLARLEAQEREAQLRALRYQINPHFLYNTLNSISALILDNRAEEADEMVGRLALFFRTGLAVDPLHDVLLADELSLQRLYLDIERVRFSDRLNVVVDVPAELTQAQVPSLILQPLVENALKHGMNPPGSQTRVEIAARQIGDRLELAVTDDGPGASGASGTGIGLENIRQRLAARFGEAASLAVERSAVRGFTVRVRMPLRLAS